MLATQLNEKVTSGELDTNCVIRLDKYICNPIQADRLFIIDDDDDRWRFGLVGTVVGRINKVNRCLAWLVSK